MKNLPLIIILNITIIGFAQERDHFKNSTRVMPLGLYKDGQTNFSLTRNLSLNFSPSYNETSPLNFYEFPLLAAYKVKKWQFYSGAQLNWLLDEKQLESGNRFGGDTFSFTIPVGARYNATENLFTEFKYSRNLLPNKIQPTFYNSNIFEFGAGIKF